MKNIVFLCLSALLLAGCSTNVPISGTVTFSDDGSPVPAGTVVFDDGKYQARGTIQSDGRYVMVFGKPGTAVPPGTYAVAITGAIELLPNPKELYPLPYVDLIDTKYADKNTSELTIDVNSSQRIYDIQVDRAKGKIPKQ